MVGTEDDIVYRHLSHNNRLRFAICKVQCPPYHPNDEDLFTCNYHFGFSAIVGWAKRQRAHHISKMIDIIEPSFLIT